MKYQSFFAVLFVLLMSCKKNVTEVAANYLPSNLSSVSVLNMANLFSKMNKDSVLLKLNNSNMDSITKSLVLDIVQNNGAKIGLDLSKNIYICNKTTSESVNNFEIIMTISDASKLEKFITNKGQNVKTIGNIKKVEGDKSIAWNNEVLIVGEHYNDKSFQSDKDNKIVKADYFQKLMSSKHDVYNFTTLDNMHNDPNMIAIATYMGMDLTVLKGNSISSYMDFNKGECIAKSDFNFNTSFTKYYSYLFNNEVKTNFSEYINEKNAIGYMTLGLNFDGFQRLLESNAMNATILKSVEERVGFKIKDLFKTLDGDLCFVYKSDSVNGKSNFKLILPKKDMKTIASLLDKLAINKFLTKSTANVYVNKELGFGNLYIDNRSKDLIINFGEEYEHILATTPIKNLQTKGIMDIYLDATKFSEEASSFGEMQANMTLKDATLNLKSKNVNTNYLEELFGLIIENMKTNKSRTQDNSKEISL